MFIRYAGPWVDVARGRHIISVHRRDTDDLTVARILPDSAAPGIRTGEVEITEAEFNTERNAINTHNDAVVDREPPPNVEPQQELLLSLAAEWETAATELRAGRNSTAAEALERAGAVARGAAGG